MTILVTGGAGFIGSSFVIDWLAQRDALCAILDEVGPLPARQSCTSQITFVEDRSGTDRRYAMVAKKLQRALAWQLIETFATGNRKTVQWYLGNQAWAADVTSGRYRDWMETQYGAGS